MRRCLQGLWVSGLLVGCGGSGSPAPQTFDFTTPKVNSQSVYTVTDVDNSSNSITLTSQQTVTAVNKDGTFLVSIVDPSSTSVTVNGTTYAITPGVYTEDPTGHDLAVTFSPRGAPSYTCTYSPHGPGPAFPLSIGQTWQLIYDEACDGAAAIVYTQSGTVVDEETITVPAGTFSTVKVQSTITWTTPIGTNVTESVTRWLDANSGAGVKLNSVYSRSGTLPVNGYLVSQTVVLQSMN